MIWIVIFFSLASKKNRKEMITVSLWTSLLSLTEQFFVPRHWSPSSLFRLAETIGFDIESLIFAAAVGGVAIMVYNRFFSTGTKNIHQDERGHPRHKLHVYTLLSAPVIFTLLILFTPLNPMYASLAALLGGGVFTWYCRADLKKKMLVSALIFTSLYFVYFLTLVLLFPEYVTRVWDLKNISGILIAGIPLEMLMYAFAFGFFWSSIYEHLTWKRINEKRV
jgi:hypothetical protein